VFVVEAKEEKKRRRRWRSRWRERSQRRRANGSWRKGVRAKKKGKTTAPP
jgi:hypothetical protein